jgi:hypothetical protein
MLSNVSRIKTICINKHRKAAAHIAINKNKNFLHAISLSIRTSPPSQVLRNRCGFFRQIVFSKI